MYKDVWAGGGARRFCCLTKNNAALVRSGKEKPHVTGSKHRQQVSGAQGDAMTRPEEGHRRWNVKHVQGRCALHPSLKQTPSQTHTLEGRKFIRETQSQQLHVYLLVLGKLQRKDKELYSF